MFAYLRATWLDAGSAEAHAGLAESLARLDGMARPPARTERP